MQLTFVALANKDAGCLAFEILNEDVLFLGTVPSHSDTGPSSFLGWTSVSPFPDARGDKFSQHSQLLHSQNPDDSPNGSRLECGAIGEAPRPIRRPR